jgi:hypothetical protein
MTETIDIKSCRTISVTANHITGFAGLIVLSSWLFATVMTHAMHSKHEIMKAVITYIGMRGSLALKGYLSIKIKSMASDALRMMFMKIKKIEKKFALTASTHNARCWAYKSDLK